MIRLCALAIAIALLAGCGKRGGPSPPGPQSDINYPKAYPTY
jgi:hypothetical protein